MSCAASPRRRERRAGGLKSQASRRTGRWVVPRSTRCRARSPAFGSAKWSIGRRASRARCHTRRRPCYAQRGSAASRRSRNGAQLGRRSPTWPAMPARSDAIRVIAGGATGFLRMAVRDGGGRSPQPALGIVRPYPLALNDMPEALADHRTRRAQASRRRRAGTHSVHLPTHQWVEPRDLAAFERWLSQPRLRIQPSPPIAAYRATEAGVP